MTLTERPWHWLVALKLVNFALLDALTLTAHGTLDLKQLSAVMFVEMIKLRSPMKFVSLNALWELGMTLKTKNVSHVASTVLLVKMQIHAHSVNGTLTQLWVIPLITDAISNAQPDSSAGWTLTKILTQDNADNAMMHAENVTGTQIMTVLIVLLRENGSFHMSFLTMLRKEETGMILAPRWEREDAWLLVLQALVQKKVFATTAQITAIHAEKESVFNVLQTIERLDWELVNGIVQMLGMDAAPAHHLSAQPVWQDG
jgi:hypothetical protein